MRRVFACAIIVLFPLLAPGFAKAQPCSGPECAEAAQAKPTKPLDILKFMREQAASTRTANPQAQPGKPRTHTVARAPRQDHHLLAARRQPAARPTSAVPVEAARSFASQEDPAVSVLASDEFNAIDAAGSPAPVAAASAETVGAGVTAEPGVPMAVADEFNDIDRKATESAARVEQARAEQISTSWLHRIWAALGSTFIALARAVHNLIG